MVDKFDRKEIRKNAISIFLERYTDVVFYFMFFTVIVIMGYFLSINLTVIVTLITLFICSSKYIIDLKLFRNEKIDTNDMITVFGKKRINYILSFLSVKGIQIVCTLPFVFLIYIFETMYKSKIKNFQLVSLNPWVIKEQFLEALRTFGIDIIIFAVIAIVIFILLYFFQMFLDFVVYIVYDFKEEMGLKQVLLKALEITKGNRISYFMNEIYFVVLFIALNLIFIVLSAIFVLINYASFILVLIILYGISCVIIACYGALARAGFYNKLTENKEVETLEIEVMN